MFFLSHSPGSCDKGLWSELRCVRLPDDSVLVRGWRTSDGEWPVSGHPRLQAYSGSGGTLAEPIRRAVP